MLGTQLETCTRGKSCGLIASTIKSKLEDVEIYPPVDCSNTTLDKDQNETGVLWNWALEEQVRIGKVHIWLWRNQSPHTEGYQSTETLVANQIKIKLKDEKGKEILIQIGNDLVEVDIGSQVDLSHHTAEVRTDNKIELGLNAVALDSMSQLRLSSEYNQGNDRFRLTKLNTRGVGEICCGRCQKAFIYELDKVNTKWFRLPSEDWEEFVEYWICHEDDNSKSHRAAQTLRKPSKNEGFVGDWFLEFDYDWINRENNPQFKKTSQSCPPDSSRSKITRDARRCFVSCNGCDFTLGEIEEISETKPNHDKSNCINHQDLIHTRNTIKLYKRSIVFTCDLELKIELNNNNAEPEFLLDDLTTRAFEITLLHDEILKLIESNGFYKILVKNFVDSKSIGLWMFCPLVFIKHINQHNKPEKLKRSKIMYVLFDGKETSEDQKKMKIFDNGAAALDSSRRIGELVLPLDHFELLIEKLISNSIYNISHPPFSRDDNHLSRSSTTQINSSHQHQLLNQKNINLSDNDHVDPGFMAIYQISYL